MEDLDSAQAALAYDILQECRAYFACEKPPVEGAIVKNFICRGGPGAGKTFLISKLCALLRELNSPESQVYVNTCAPTNMASRQVHGCTIYKAFNLTVFTAKRKMDENSILESSLGPTTEANRVITGLGRICHKLRDLGGPEKDSLVENFIKKSSLAPFSNANNPELTEKLVTVTIVDEVSMIPDWFMKSLNSFLLRSTFEKSSTPLHLLVLFGDPNQTKPIEWRDSVFDHGFESTLLCSKSYQIGREVNHRFDEDFKLFIETLRTTHLFSYSSLKDHLKKSELSDRIVADYDGISDVSRSDVFICFQNDRVAFYNQFQATSSAALTAIYPIVNGSLLNVIERLPKIIERILRGVSIHYLLRLPEGCKIRVIRNLNNCCNGEVFTFGSLSADQQELNLRRTNGEMITIRRISQRISFKERESLECFQSVINRFLPAAPTPVKTTFQHELGSELKISFRLVYDSLTGKPRGFGFCEFSDANEAECAIRNLNNEYFNGRKLTVKRRKSNAVRTESEPHQLVIAAVPAYDPCDNFLVEARDPNVIAKIIDSLPSKDIWKCLQEMRSCVKYRWSETRNMLLQNPQLAYALLRAFVASGILDEHQASCLICLPHENPASHGMHGSQDSLPKSFPGERSKKLM
ncbi:Cleavage stimulation factor subunit 2 [Halotydeus destructor]|nr:Cleavage stimulation factor subunit 2 [Halotydeus destructor]